jgi:hypothetical protein
MCMPNQHDTHGVARPALIMYSSATSALQRVVLISITCTLRLTMHASVYCSCYCACICMQCSSRHGSISQQQQQQQQLQSEHSAYNNNSIPAHRGAHTSQQAAATASAQKLQQQQQQQHQLSSAFDSLAISSNSAANSSSAHQRQRHHANGAAAGDVYTTNDTAAANNTSMITTPVNHHQLHRGASVNALSVGSANVHMSSRHGVAALERDTKLLRDMVAVTVQDSVASLREDLQQDIRGLHLDLLRQFADQQEEIATLLKGHTTAISNLVAENEALRRENAELKRFY